MSRPALRLAEAPLSVEREALAAAIALHGEAARLARANAEAHERAEAAVTDTYGHEMEAERTLTAAKAATAPRLAAEFRGETAEPGPTMAEAEAELAAVRQKRVDIRAARDALSAELGLSRNRASWKLDAVKADAALVVKTSPEARALVDAFADAERRHARLRQAVRVLKLAGALPDCPSFDVAQSVDRSTEMAWIGALEALTADPSATLPEVP